MNWQRAAVQAAAAYLRDRIGAGADDVRARAVYEGLLDVLEPNRRTLRHQQEMAAATKSSVPVAVARERRTQADQRRHQERRHSSLGPPDGTERRTGGDRRAGGDRRERV
jgi:hypothetical protein